MSDLRAADAYGAASRHGRTLRADSGMVGRFAPTAAWSDASRRQRHGRTLRADSGMVGRFAPTAAWSDASRRQRHDRALFGESVVDGWPLGEVEGTSRAYQET